MWASSLLGVMDSGTATIEPRGHAQAQWTFYAQDDFSSTARITLNLGLRWEREPLRPRNQPPNWSRTLDLTQNAPRVAGL